MNIFKTRNVKTPERGTDKSAGIDFFIPNDLLSQEQDRQIDNLYELNPGESACIPSGIKAEVPEGFALIAFNKSGVALNKNLSVGACVIDEDYQGEIHLHVFNRGNKVVILSAGDKLVQFILVPVFYDCINVVNAEDQLFNSKTSERGQGGFGSTGNK